MGLAPISKNLGSIIYHIVMSTMLLIPRHSIVLAHRTSNIRLSIEYTRSLQPLRIKPVSLRLFLEFSWRLNKLELLSACTSRCLVAEPV